MGKRALFVFTPNQYNVVFDMMKQVASYLEREMGYEVGCCGVGEDYQKARLGDWDFIFSVQGMEFEFLPETDGKKHITWVCDHPKNVLARFVGYADGDNMYIGCVDRNHITYLKKYYGIENGLFMPHFGWKAKQNISYEERSIEVFYPSTYTYWEEEVKPRYCGLEGPLKIITEKTIDYIIEHDEFSLEDGMTAVLEELGETDTVDLVRECIEFVGEYIDSYWRTYYQNRIIKSLLRAGIKITVCGRNWNRVKCELPEGRNLTVLSEELPYEQVVEKIADSKMVLNVVPSFKDGGHERIAMATLNGAVCLTDSSLYIEEVFGGSEGVIVYDGKKPELLAERIKYLLENPKEAEQIAKRGQMVAEENLTVKNFVDTMLKVLEI